MVKKEKRYYTIEEKRAMAARGEHVPICIDESSKCITDFIVPIHRYIPSKRKHKKAPKLKL